MSRRPSPLAAQLRRRLLRRPAFSAQPRCPACGKERDPKDFAASGLCRPCEMERELEYAVRMHAEFWPDGSPRVERPVDDVFATDAPFLPDDEEQGR